MEELYKREGSALAETLRVTYDKCKKNEGILYKHQSVSEWALPVCLTGQNRPSVRR